MRELTVGAGGMAALTQEGDKVIRVTFTKTVNPECPRAGPSG